jgi:hypothetical protein
MSPTKRVFMTYLTKTLTIVTNQKSQNIDTTSAPVSPRNKHEMSASFHRISLGFLGASPQTPRVGFAEGWAAHNLPRSGTTLFASCSIVISKYPLCEAISSNFTGFFWGQAPKPPGSASPRVGQPITFREAKLRFSLLFLEKEKFYRSIVNQNIRHARPHYECSSFSPCQLHQLLVISSNFTGFFWGQAPKPPGSASPRVGQPITFREAELRFLLLFLEREEFYRSSCLRFVWAKNKKKKRFVSVV